MPTYHGIMAHFRKQMEAHSLLSSSCSPSPLFGVRARDETINQAGQLSPFVKSHLSMLSRINYTSNVRDRDTRLGNVGG